MTRKAFPLSLDEVVGSVKKSRPLSKNITSKTDASVTEKLQAARQREQRANQSGAAAVKKSSEKIFGTATEKAGGRIIDQRAQPVSGLGLDSDRARLALVGRLRAGGFHDAMVLKALATIPRHSFVDTGLVSQAYEDMALPIGYEQTISKPSVVARMITLLRQDKAPNELLGKVLEIGTGCGYQAAVLSKIAHEVYSIERIRALFEKAKSNLRPLRIANLRLHYGDGMLGLPQAGPFDAIILAAAGLAIPQALREQLAIGGKLVAPVVNDKGQALQVTVRQSDTMFYETMLEGVLFVPLKSGVI